MYKIKNIYWLNSTLLQSSPAVAGLSKNNTVPFKYIHNYTQKLSAEEVRWNRNWSESAEVLLLLQTVLYAIAWLINHVSALYTILLPWGSAAEYFKYLSLLAALQQCVKDFIHLLNVLYTFTTISKQHDCQQQYLSIFQGIISVVGRDQWTSINKRVQ